MLYHIPAAALVGFILDLLFGDPVWLYHPVRMMGNLISVSERGLRRLLPKGCRGERIGGIILVFLLLFAGGMVPYTVLRLFSLISPYLKFVAECFFCYQIMATKALKVESMKVYHELKRHDIESARYAVSMIVGRDTDQLTEEGITKATVETIAENASDGVIAPLFYMMIGGPVAGFLYKAVNTMDSMVGYKNDNYRCFGTAAAVLDDIVNFIPARIGGILMAVSTIFCGLDLKQAFIIFFRDRKNHASPNSAQTEAAMAGALGIRLAGDAVYFGKIYKKPFIGDAHRPVEVEDIRRANLLLYMTAVICAILFFVVSILARMYFAGM